jgi:ribonuclease T2
VQRKFVPYVTAGLVGLALAAPAAQAFVVMSGSFVASKACPAPKNIKKNKNPGNIAVTPGQSYVLLGKNKETASYYKIEIPGAKPLKRWVAADCGSTSAALVTPPADGGAGAGTDAGDTGGNKAGDKAFFILALSWEPAFCENYPDKAECRPQRPDAYSSTHLSLHGLWPQPSRIAYCNVDAAVIEADKTHHWYDLPVPDLAPATKAALDQAMPGTQSVLERHEWIKHGTCYPGARAETYFQDMLRLAAAVNASPVQAFLAANVGRTVEGSALRARFDEAFGAGAGQRVRLSCQRDGDRQLISEITIGLKGDISAGTPLQALMAASSPTDPGCPSGIVDPAGLQ